MPQSEELSYADSIKQNDGELLDFGGYVYYTPKDRNRIVLDGDFSLEQLKSIVEYMEKNNAPE